MEASHAFDRFGMNGPAGAGGAAEALEGGFSEAEPGPDGPHRAGPETTKGKLATMQWMDELDRRGSTNWKRPASNGLR